MKFLWTLIIGFLVSGFVLLNISCLSMVENMVEKTGQVLDGSAFAEKTVAKFAAEGIELREVQNRGGENSAVITLSRFPAMKIRGSAPNEQGAFSLSSLDYLGGNPQGWNEYRLDLFGSGNLEFGETTARLLIHDGVEPVEISSGRIRRYDTRIVGSQAVTSLRNRRERVLAITEWMNASQSPAFNNREEFELYWKPLLFPEMVSRRHRPADWQQADDLWIRAEDIRWNTSYTERVFPELLREIRNSGTMLRDWEEALDWIYIEFEWSRILEQLSQEIVLNKK
jgi:hypothetical protein